MQVYATPPPVIPLDEAATAAGMSEDDLVQALAANGKRLVAVSSVKYGVLPADLDEVEAGASDNAVIRSAPAMSVEGQDPWPWGTDFVPALGISGTPVLTGQNGVAYAGFTVTGSGGDQPYAYSLVGVWPDGIDVDPNTGEVSGTPEEEGTFSDLSVRVTDERGTTADLDTFAIELDPA